MRSRLGRAAVFVPLAVLALWGSPGPAAGAQEAPKSIAAAIDSMRGHRFDRLSDPEKDNLGRELDEAWSVLTGDPDAARPAIRAVLAKERADHFLVLDLAHLLLLLDPAASEEVAVVVAQADAKAHPPATFHAASRMAASGCQKCLPAVLKILELETLDTAIPAHALGIDISLGLIFTVGHYGDGAVEAVRARLGSESCVVRGNAAMAYGLLLGEGIPTALVKIATGDPCPEARAKAWVSLGYLEEPSLARLAARRLDSEPGPEAHERLAMAQGLSESFSPSVLPVLRRLAEDQDPKVKEQARRGLTGVGEVAPRVLERALGWRSVPESARAKLQKELKRAVKEGRFDADDDYNPERILSAATPEDLPLLRQARAAVLGRLSDECLSEYLTLTYAARALRAARSRTL